MNDHSNDYFESNGATTLLRAVVFTEVEQIKLGFRQADALSDLLIVSDAPKLELSSSEKGFERCGQSLLKHV